MRLSLTPLAALVGCLCLVAVGAGGYAALGHRRAEAADATRVAYTDSIRAARAVAIGWKAAYARAATRAATASDGVTVARTVWRTRVDTLPADPKTLDQARATIASLRAAGDALADSTVNLQTRLARLRRTSDSTIAAQDRTIGLQDRLTAVLSQQLADARRGPRLSGQLVGLYDPLAAQHYASSVQVAVRVVGDWSVVARADRRFEPEGSHVYVGVSHPLF